MKLKRFLLLGAPLATCLADPSQAETATPEHQQPAATPPAEDSLDTERSVAPSAAPSELPPEDAPDEARPAPPVEPRPGAGYQEVTPSGDAPPPAPPPNATQDDVYEPPLPTTGTYEPPLPPRPKHTAPKTSLWAGGKLGWAFPAGDMWWDGRWIDAATFRLERRPFKSFASSGPKTELNAGVRLARRYNILAHWEYANLGQGETLDDDLGGQNRGHMHFFGGGFRFSSDPDDLGVVVEAVMGYRSFQTSWGSGTTFATKDSFLNTRLSFGADIRLSPLLSLSPMFGLAGGFFEEVTWKYSDGTTEDGFTEFDSVAQHTVITLDLGAHFDLLRSSD